MTEARTSASGCPRARSGARRLRFIGLRTVLVLAAAGCGESFTGPPGGVDEITRLPRDLSPAEVEVIGAGNRFALRLLAQANHPGENLFLSPFSASMALGMTMNGAAGETWSQMRDVLGFGDLAEDEINAAYASLLELLVGLDPAVETAVGNSVWTRRGFPVHADFLAAVRGSFKAEVAELDFADPSASVRINEWVRAATNGRIEDIVPAAIPGNVVMYLINAIYFKAPWTFQFDPSDTRSERFHLDDGSTRAVPLMTLRRDLPYQENARFQAVDLPYGGSAFSMTVLLPAPDVSVDELAASLDAAQWEEIADSFRETDVSLFLPRFRMARERTLNDDLRALGMVDAFDHRADLSRLSPAGGLWISSVKQKSWVEVNEEGTEAAAATGVIVVTSAGPVVRADRPFLFFIRERLSGTILFAGKFASPPAG
ncbi:MAG: serpin family protein [Gemmatimonadota bacterium]|uniref:serpin family protein n=1 Tax=Candidatus Palauibacter scopulicola TaxID=3056741 RepID=UPI00238747AF|nr:serpin family protein [Candidatus Palauibacter scopulicola]MDE2663075.1 serpin family protein [Candidatus Palauibacter scopulicola]